MKYSLLALALIAIFTSSCKQAVIQPIKTIFLVRHAEKESDGTTDPMLTLEGQKRAELLAKMLADVGVSKIYSSNYNRTKSTAEPLSKLLGVEIVIYDPKKQAELLKTIGESTDSAILIVGHSNSIPQLCNLFLAKEAYQALDESQYDHIFVINKSGSTMSSYLLKY